MSSTTKQQQKIEAVLNTLAAHSDCSFTSDELMNFLNQTPYMQNQGNATPHISMDKKMRIEKIKKNFEGSDSPQKPIYGGPGKSIKRASENFKEFIKQKEDIPLDVIIPREDYKKYKTKYSYESTKYEDAEWNDFITKNMIFEQDM